MQSQTRRIRPAVFLVIVTGTLMIFLLVTPLRRWAVQILTEGTRPLTQMSLALSERFGWSTAIRQLTPTELRLQEELAATAKQLAAARQELQARQTADQLGEFLTTVSYPTVAAAVIGYSPDPGIQSLIINVGRHANIQSGQPVITGDGWMIGKVVTVHETTSVVLLLTDAQSLVLASIQNQQLSQGVVRGDRGLTVRMDLIPKNDPLTVGQSVVTSGLEVGIPPDLLIGTLSNLEQRSGEVFQRARITIPIRYGRVRQVAVITQ